MNGRDLHPCPAQTLDNACHHSCGSISRRAYRVQTKVANEFTLQLLTSLSSLRLRKTAYPLDPQGLAGELSLY